MPTDLVSGQTRACMREISAYLGPNRLRPCWQRRLAERGWVTALPSGRFTPREPTVPARAGAGMPSGRGGGS